MKTFAVQTLGCKVNQYEGEQIAALLRARGMVETDAAHAELRVVNTCSVTVQAGSKSRQTARRNVRLPLLGDPSPATDSDPGDISHSIVGAPGAGNEAVTGRRPRVVLTGCWATSDPRTAAAMRGVDAVLTHRDDVASELDRLLLLWRSDEANCEATSIPAEPHAKQRVAAAITPDLARTKEWDGWMERAGWSEAGERTERSKSISRAEVNVKPVTEHEMGAWEGEAPAEPRSTTARGDVRAAGRGSPGGSPSQNWSAPGAVAKGVGTTRLPLLGARQTGRQRALLKVQDGCDAHCTYCIIPKLRPGVWSKPIGDAVREASDLVASGHCEIVLNGIFLGAYGQPTALRRRQRETSGETLGRLVEALCTRVPGLLRLRLSSLEPGDLTDELLRVLTSHPQVVPHFHLPLQSGSDTLLRRMNRQYGRDEFLRLVDCVRAAFDRPALTTDVIAGFPGETDEEFERTVEVVDFAGFIHVHAFSFSPRPGTAAARWTRDFVRGPVVNERIERLTARAAVHSEAFRRSFIGQMVELLVEQDESESPGELHGRCERWFGVHFSDDQSRPGDRVTVRIDRVSGNRTEGTLVSRSPRR